MNGDRSILELMPRDVFKEVLRILELESPDTLKSVALVSWDLYYQARKFTYQHLVIEDYPTSIHRITLLLARIKADSEIAPYIRRLRVAGLLRHRDSSSLIHLDGQLIRLLKKLPLLQSLHWDTEQTIPWEIINWVNSKQPACKLWIGGRCFSRPTPPQIVRLQNLSCLVFLCLSMDARDVGAFGCLQSTIMTCPALRLLDLALVWVGDWMHGAPIIRGFRLTNGQRLPPLEHLILAGFPTALHRGIEDTWREALDLSRLKGLYLRDFREQAFNWWQETNLGSLKYFGASYPERSNNHLNFDAIPPQVESFFYRNQKIEMLGLVDFMNHMELRWLAPLSSTLHTLRIHEQSRRRRAIGANFDSRRFLTHGDILLLGKLLPNLHTLKLDIRATPNWPYGTLTSIAIAFPWLHYLEIDFDLYYETESKLLRHGYPVATMNRAASSWSHLWRILASQDTATRKRATGNVPGPDKPMDVNICRPHLKALAIIVGPPSKTLDGSRGGVSQQFHVCISKRAEEAEQGIATVTSSAVEDQLQSTPLIDSESEMAERKKTLSICRYKAEVGTIEWPISHAPTFEFEIPPHWGAKRTVQPSDIFPDKCLKFNELKTSIVGLSQETVDNLRCLAAVTPSDV